jgi:hypothetical protein
MAKSKEEIMRIIADINISDLKARKEVEKIVPGSISSGDSTEILDCFKKNRPQQYSKWQLEIASGYF